MKKDARITTPSTFHSDHEILVDAQQRFLTKLVQLAVAEIVDVKKAAQKRADDAVQVLVDHRDNSCN